MKRVEFLTGYIVTDPRRMFPSSHGPIRLYFQAEPKPSARTGKEVPSPSVSGLPEDVTVSFYTSADLAVVNAPIPDNKKSSLRNLEVFSIKVPDHRVEPVKPHYYRTQIQHIDCTQTTKLSEQEILLALICSDQSKVARQLGLSILSHPGLPQNLELQVYQALGPNHSEAKALLAKNAKPPLMHFLKMQRVRTVHAN